MESANSYEEVDDVIIKFIQNLSNTLEADKERLEKLCTENNEQMKTLRLKKNYLISMIWENLDTTNLEQGTFVDFLLNSNKLWNGSLQNGMHQIEQAVVQHNGACIDWKQNIEKNLQLKGDNFTMMPFHDIEAEIQILENKIKDIKKEASNTVEKLKLKISTLESQSKLIWKDNTILQSYEKEMREEKSQLNETLSAIKRKRQLDVLQSRLDDQQMLELQQEIEELQEEIKGLEKVSK